MTETMAQRIRAAARKTITLRGADGQGPFELVVRKLSPYEAARFNVSGRLPMFRPRTVGEPGEDAEPAAELQESDAPILGEMMAEVVKLAAIKPRVYDTVEEAEAADGIAVSDLGGELGDVWSAIINMSFGNAAERDAAGRFRDERPGDGG